MNAQVYWLCLLMYVCGTLLHLFWIKIPSLKEKAKSLEYDFSLSDWWKHDWNVILGNIVFGAMLLMGLKEFVVWKPEFADKVKWFFGFMGTFGSSVAMAKFGKLDKVFKEMFDEKLQRLKTMSNNSETGL